MLKSSVPNEVKVNINIDDFTLRSNLTSNETIKFTTKTFFSTILGFTQSCPGPLVDMKGFFQKMPGNYKGEKLFNITRNDEIHSKCDCCFGSLVNGAREPVLLSFKLDKPPGRIKLKEPIF